jgi:transposase-like protein
VTGKRPSDSRSAGPACTRKKIDLEQKVEMLKQYEGGQSLSSIARELDLATSTVKSNLNDNARIKEHVKGSAPLKPTVITEQRSGAIYEMEKLLTTWMEDQIQKRAPLEVCSKQ